MPERRQTALGVARARFVEGLPRKAREVRASLALLAGTPDEERPREELRRRLHALYASAQVFRIEPLAAALKDALADIDRVREAKRGFTQDELDALASLAATLTALGRAGDDEDPSVAGGDELAPESDAETVPPVAGAVDPFAPPSPSAPPHAPQPQPKSVRSGADRVASVLLVGTPEDHAHVRAALEPERYELLAAATGDEALRLARSAAPDLVIADLALTRESDLVVRLREDPLTDFVPVILLVSPDDTLDPIRARELGADEVLARPLDAASVRKTVEQTLETLAGPAGASTLTGQLTVEQLAERLADEMRRGLVEAAEKGRDVAIPVGDGSTLLAAAWSAIGRVRSHIAERSGGRVRFRELPARGGPAFVSVVGEDAVDDDSGAEGVSLAGRRVIVCDDDPAVVWFFAELFREHGADVVEASDGLEALEQARCRRPDLVVSDVLMPRLDGFGLTRALKRDPMLADTPVILLSWKEDFLQRMRELKAGANGHLRKEAAAVQILAAVRDVLRPRARLESRLRAGGDVRGRLEDVGIATLLTTVAALRPDARLTVRDASSLYEVDLRDGDVVDVNRTASDGSFARGPRVLETLLGVTAGRYTVADADGPVRRSIDAKLEVALDAGMRALAARVDAVSGKNLARVAKVELDEDLLGMLLRSSTEDVERIAEHLRAGRAPRELLMEGRIEPQVLEEVLADLARRGAIVAVLGEDGEDRVAMAREAREKALSTPPADEPTMPSWFPSELRETSSLEDELRALRPLESAGRRLEEPEPPSQARSSSAQLPVLDEPFGDDRQSAPRPPEVPAAKAGRDKSKDDAERDRREHAARDGEHAREQPGAADGGSLRDDAGEGERGDAHEEGGESEPPQKAHPDVRPAGAVPSAASTGRAPQKATAETAASRRAVPAPAPSAPRAPQATPTAPSAGASAGGWLRLVVWALVLAALAGVGFVAWSAFVLPPRDVAEERIGPLPPEPSPATGPDEAAEPPAEGDDESAQAPSAGAEPLAPAYGREEAGIADVGVTVAADRGLLVLEPAPAPVSVRIGTRTIELGTEPVAIPMSPGVHHLVYRRGDTEDYIWVAVRAGHTRYVPPLP